MATNFNFTTPGSGTLNFNFGEVGPEPYYDFNFTESGYTLSEPYDFNFGEGFNIYTILKGTSNNFVAIWADLDAGLNNGKMYIGSQGNFQVINLSDQTIHDWYTQTEKGRGNETLDNNDIVDINVTGGV